MLFKSFLFISIYFVGIIFAVQQNKPLETIFSPKVNNVVWNNFNGGCNEDNSCTVPQTVKYGVIAYGGDYKFYFAPIKNKDQDSDLKITCGNTFGDIAVGHSKQCHYAELNENQFKEIFPEIQSTTGGHNNQHSVGYNHALRGFWHTVGDSFPAGWTKMSTGGGHEIFRLTGHESSMDYQGSVVRQQCKDSFYGHLHKNKDQNKRCSAKGKINSHYPAADWNYCGAEGGTCKIENSGIYIMSYGAHKPFHNNAFRIIATNKNSQKIRCDNGYFPDPHPGAQKKCYITPLIKNTQPQSKSGSKILPKPGRKLFG